jgi:hypothetical protein
MLYPYVDLLRSCVTSTLYNKYIHIEPTYEPHTSCLATSRWKLILKSASRDMTVLVEKTVEPCPAVLLAANGSALCGLLVETAV